MVELYVSRAEPGAVERAAQLTQRVAQQMTTLGTPVRFLRSIYVAEDETCFFLCEAASVEAVRETARRAALSFERIAETATPTSTEEVQQCP